MDSYSDRWAAEHRLSAETSLGSDELDPTADDPDAYVDAGELGLDLALDLAEKTLASETFQSELAELVELLAHRLLDLQGAVVANQKAVLARLDAARPSAQAATPEGDPMQSLDNVLAGLGLIVSRLDEMRALIKKRDEGDSTITFDQTGRPSRIRRSDGSESEIAYDNNRRQVVVRRR